MTAPKVYAAINAVQAELAKEGIAKDRTNPQQNYKFRGIDDIYNALSSLLAKHKLCILPRMISRDCSEKQSKTGGTLFYVVMLAEFRFISAEDGSEHVVTTYGEAMDSGDKATNKAMSAAYKYACMQAFAIPTEGDNDTENQTHEVAASPPPKSAPKKTTTKEPNYVVMATERMKQHGATTKPDFDLIIRFVTKDTLTPEQLKASQDDAKVFCEAFDAFAKDNPGKKLLDVAKSADTQAQADKVF